MSSGNQSPGGGGDVRVPANRQEWEELLSATMEGRSAAAAGDHLDKLLTNPKACAPLMSLICESGNQNVRQLAGVLLRARLPSYWKKLGNPQRTQVQRGLLASLHKEEFVPAIAAVSELAAATALLSVPVATQWPELLPYVKNAGASSVPRHRTIGLRLLRCLMEAIPDEIRPILPGLAKFLLSILKDTNSVVRIAGVQCLKEACGIIENPNEAKLIASMLPSVGNFLTAALKTLTTPDIEESLLSSAEDEAISAMECLSEALASEVPIVQGKLGQLVDLFVKIMSNKSVPQLVRSASLNFFQHASFYCRREFLATQKLGLLVTLTFAYGAEVEDDDADLAAPITPFEAASELMDHLIQTIKPIYLYKPSTQLIVNWLKSSPHLQRRMALTCLGHLAQTYLDEVTEDLPKILPLLSQAMADPSPLVRATACLTFGLMADEIQPEMSSYHARLVPMLTNQIDDPDSSVRPKALFALQTYCEHLDFDVTQYLPRLMNKLLKILEHAPLEEKEMAFTTISALAAAADHEFVRFAKPVISFCRHAMSSIDPKLILLRARATECLGIVAVSIGAKYMNPLVKPFLGLALDGLKLKQAHELSEYTVSLFSNFCTMLGPDFLPFCRVIVPIVNHIILANDHEHRVYLADFPQDKRPQDLSSTFPAIIRESFIDEKIMAVTAIGIFASKLGVAFHPWLEDSINTVLALKNDKHPAIREIVFRTLADLIGVVYLHYPADEQWVPGKLGAATVNPACYEVLKSVVPLIIVATMADPAPKVVTSALKTLSDIANVVGPSALKKEFMEQIKVAMATLFAGRAACQKRADLDDRDTDPDFVQIFFDVTDLFMDLSIPFGSAFKPYFDDLLPIFLRYLAEDKGIPYREGAMGTLAEALRNMDDSSPYIGKLMPLIAKSLQQQLDKGEGLRRNAAYCAGVIVQTSDESILPHLGKIAVMLKPLLAEKSACSDNAAGSLARIILHGLQHNQNLPFAEMLKGILAAMPIVSDYEPLTPICEAVLVSFQYAQNNTAASPSKNIISLTPQIFSKLAPMLTQSIANRRRLENRSAPLSPNQSAKILDSDVESSIINLLKKLYHQYESQLQKVIQDLPEQTREILQSVLTQ